MKKIVAGGGVLFRYRGSHLEIVLIRRNGIWDLPKGKQEDGESIEQCSVREVAEEVGVHDPLLVGWLCETWHTYRLDKEVVGKKTVWFSMILNDPQAQFIPEHEEGITETEWVEATEALERVGFDNLRKVIRRLVTCLAAV